MIIRHNHLASNASRMLQLNSFMRDGSMKKLSSGYRINTAADDAAGLTISEKMRSQIRGLTKATENIQDGISMTNVIDGALSEVTDMLHRQTELLVKSANGTNTSCDRHAIQMEIDQLAEEIERVFSSTTFNEKYVFKAKPIITAEYDKSESETISSPTKYEDNTGKVGKVTTDPVTYYFTNEISLGKDKFGIEAFKRTHGAVTSTTTTDRKIDETNVSINRKTDSHIIEFKDNAVMIQSGSQAGNMIPIRLYDLSVEDYNIDKIDATTAGSSLAGIKTIDNFLDNILEYRSYYGAVTNKLEHALNNTNNIIENTQAAESHIRDADMASEMVRLSKYNVLMQVGQSMLAQANQNPNMVLSLLQ